MEKKSVLVHKVPSHFNRKIKSSSISIASAYHSSRSFTENSYETINITKLIDSISSKNLESDNNEFKKQIDDLNLKFYLETEKYLSSKVKDEKCQNALFVILFKQIGVYIAEIERLNVLLSDKKYNTKSIIDRIEDNKQHQKEFQIKENIIKILKESKEKLEKNLFEVIESENNLRIENESLRKENEMYKKALLDTKNKKDEQRMSELTKAGSNISNDIDTAINTKTAKQSCFSKSDNIKLIKAVKKKFLITHMKPKNEYNK